MKPNSGNQTQETKLGKPNSGTLMKENMPMQGHAGIFFKYIHTYTCYTCIFTLIHTVHIYIYIYIYDRLKKHPLPRTSCWGPPGRSINFPGLCVSRSLFDEFSFRHWIITAIVAAHGIHLVGSLPVVISRLVADRLIIPFRRHATKRSLPSYYRA